MFWISAKAIPNLLSLFRILVGLIFPWVPSSWRLTCVGLAALTDLADGATSRWLQAESDFGRMLDPVADKIFLLAVVGTLIGEGLLSIGEVLAIVIRDVAVLAGCAWVALHQGLGRWGQLRPRLLGKATTVLQIIFLLVVMAELETLRPYLLVVTALCSGLSAGDYLRTYLLPPRA